MINLLPISEKKRVNAEYRTRLLAVFLFLVSVLISVGIVLLFPSLILSSFEYKGIFNQLAIEKIKLTDTIGTEDPIKTTDDVNSKLAILKKEGYLTPHPYAVFETIINRRPENVKIISMFYDREALKGKITVSGISKDRETLLSFMQSLEDESIFTNVDLPISSFVEGEDINFSIVITIERKSSTETDNDIQ